MRYTFVRREFPGSNPIANVFVIIAGALVIGLAVVLGFFALLALGALVLVSAAVLGVRMWWLQRKLARRGSAASGERAPPAEGGVIEGEYRVVRRDTDEA